MQLISVVENEYLEDDNFTISYYPEIDSWFSFHDYFCAFINLRSKILSFQKDRIWLHNAEGRGNFYGDVFPSYLTPVINWQEKYPHVLENLSWICNVGETRQLDKTFDWILVANSYQATNETEIIVYDNSKTLSENYDIYNVKRIKNYWNFNKFKSLTTDPNYPVIVDNLDSLIEASGNISATKPFYLKRPFIDNFVIVKLTSLNEEPFKFFEIVETSRQIQQ